LWSACAAQDVGNEKSPLPLWKMRLRRICEPRPARRRWSRKRQKAGALKTLISTFLIDRICREVRNLRASPTRNRLWSAIGARRPAGYALLSAHADRRAFELELLEPRILL